MKIVYALHTSFALVEALRKEFTAGLPGVRVVNVVDDSLLPDVRAAGGLTAAVTRRMASYAMAAQASGAHALFSCCSSVGEAVDVIRTLVDIPVVKIDEKMAEEASAAGERVAVVATVATTLDPTARLIERKARDAGRAVRIRRHLVEGAFDILMAGDAERHDTMVLAEIARASSDADVVVLAQASMARLSSRLPRGGARVLTSPASGVAELRRILDLD